MKIVDVLRVPAFPGSTITSFPKGSRILCARDQGAGFVSLYVLRNAELSSSDTETREVRVIQTGWVLENEKLVYLDTLVVNTVFEEGHVVHVFIGEPVAAQE